MILLDERVITKKQLTEYIIINGLKGREYDGTIINSLQDPCIIAETDDTRDNGHMRVEISVLSFRDGDEEEYIEEIEIPIEIFDLLPSISTIYILEAKYKQKLENKIKEKFVGDDYQHPYWYKMPSANSNDVKKRNDIIDYHGRRYTSIIRNHSLCLENLFLSSNIFSRASCW